MRLLVLGGTVFVGRHLVDEALARGHEVTLFNRGRTNPELHPAVERLRGDRDSDLSALAQGRWDAAIDTSGYTPTAVRAACVVLADRLEHYTFVSSVSVYADFRRPGLDEDAAVAQLPGGGEELTEETYGPLKALAERAAEEVMPGRVLAIRPGVIAGPHDPTDRFTYWVRRGARGGELLAPGRPERSVQLIDARDLAGWMLDMAERRRTGTYNAPGPPVAMADVIEACRTPNGEDARPVWTDDEFLLQAGVEPFTELPLWIPESEDARGFFEVDSSKAIADGLAFRALGETARDTLAWDREREASPRLDLPLAPRAPGLDQDREARLLREWAARRG